MDAPEPGAEPRASVRNEADLQREVELLLKSRPSLLWHHCAGRALHCRGTRGVPDLLITGPGGLAFAELKMNGRLGHGQTDWKYLLLMNGARYFIWDSADLRSGEIAAVLDGLAVPAPG